MYLPIHGWLIFNGKCIGEYTIYMDLYGFKKGHSQKDNAPWDWNIYLHENHKFMVKCRNKYFSPMEHMGKGSVDLPAMDFLGGL